MKAFWAILAALILAGGAYLFVAARQSQTQAIVARTAAAQKAEQDALPATTAARESEQKAQAANSITAADLEALKKQQQDLAAQLAKAKEESARLEAQAKPPSATPYADPAKSEASPPESAAETKPDSKPQAPKADTKPADQPPPSSNDGYSITGGVAPPGVTGTPATPVAAPAAKPSDSKEEPKVAKPDARDKFQGFEVIPAKIETKEDGSMLVDGKYLIKGEGTADKPYLVPWDVLTSVEETFDPQSAKKKLPQRITMFDGKVVKLSGYIAFPLAIKETKECLSMLNQWDGCCIGVPPTPNDAVEVSRTRTIKGEERFTTAGSVTGTFKVKPYLQGDWLIGLYVMEAADLKSRDYGGAAGS
jgi:hypothetical protein